LQTDRWRQIERLFHSALECAPHERATYLMQACAGDDELRREVESLLAAHFDEGSTIERVASDLAAEWLEEQRAAVAQSIGRFRIISLLGKGGMGEVWLAEDTDLHRKVAVKLLLKEITANGERLRRFEREARAASALNHPNIITIYEIGQADEKRFIATEFVDGETLRQRMAGNPMELFSALDVALQVTLALSAAHEAGIIHRDIKPENIMVRPDGLVKVLDFGLAKLAAQQPETSPDPVYAISVSTTPGMVIGTVRYMSPEQSRGMDVDARTDIFSVGVLLYEMITGHAPFEGTTMSDVIAAILTSEPRPLSHYASGIPHQLELIVARALKKERDERYQSIKELHDDLKSLKQLLKSSTLRVSSRLNVAPRLTRRHRVMVSALVLTLLGLIGSGIYLRTRSSDRQTIDSIAILPFANVGADPSTEYLADGIPESLINNLSRLSNLRVVPRGIVFGYKGQKLDPQEVGSKLGVHTVLTGKVTRLGDRLNIQVDLVDVERVATLWGNQYNRQPSDILTVQEEIAKQIVDALQLQLNGVAPQHLARGQTDNPEAYRLYLLGRYHWNKFDESGFKKSIEYFQQAIDKDSNYALAHAGMADAYALLGVEHLRPKDFFPQAKIYAEKALRLDDTLAEAHNSLGIVKLFYEWNWAEAERAFIRARELDPNYANAGHFYGHYLEAMGRMDEAIHETKRALESDPLSLIINAELGFAYYWARQYDQAITQYRRTLDMDPNFFFASMAIAQAYQHNTKLNERERYGKALAELTGARPIARGWPYIEGELACVYARLGMRVEAQKILDELKDRAAHDWVDPLIMAFVYTDLGDKDQAFAWLDKAYEERATWIIWLGVEPKFDSLRSDKRFAELLRRIGLPQ
jgi:serine/threonine protein kinase/Tfp pilus assembly protein PilF